MEEKDKTFVIRIISFIQLIVNIIGAIFALSGKATLQGIILLVSGLVIFAILRGFESIIEELGNINKSLKNSK